MLQSLVVSSGLARSRIIYIINVTMPDKNAAMIECEAARIMTAGRILIYRDGARKRLA